MSVPIAYIAVILIWSTTPLGIQWSGVDGSFAFGVALRMGIGLIALLIGTELNSEPISKNVWLGTNLIISGLAIK